MYDGITFLNDPTGLYGIANGTKGVIAISDCWQSTGSAVMVSYSCVENVDEILLTVHS